MRPVLFEVAGVAVPAFEAMALLAFAVTGAITIAEARRRGLDVSIAPVAGLAALVGAAAGARLHWAILHPSALASDPRAALLGGGLSSYGSLIGSALALVLVVRLRRMPLGEAANAAAVALPVGCGIARIGCLLVGDDYGRPSALPWAMAFPEGRPPAPTPVHPTQAYEILLMIPIFLYLWSCRRTARPGFLLFAFWVLYGLARFAIDFAGTGPPVAAGLTATQWISLGFVAAGGWGMRRTRPSSSPAVS
jgi:phosphatidylglycerol:prolipoprotein diacylglycerol transferase